MGPVKWKIRVVECTSTFFESQEVDVTLCNCYVQFTRQQFVLFFYCHLLHTRHHRASWTLSQKAVNNKDQDLPGMVMVFFVIKRR